MGIIILLIIIFAAVYMVTPKPDQVGSEPYSDKIAIEKKQCPPHQWFWQEIVDQDGNVQGQRIVCKVCGPLSKQIDGGVE